MQSILKSCVFTHNSTPHSQAFSFSWSDASTVLTAMKYFSPAHVGALFYFLEYRERIDLFRCTDICFGILLKIYEQMCSYTKQETLRSLYLLKKSSSLLSFTEYECLFPYWQHLVSGNNPEPDKSSLHPLSHSIFIRSILGLSSFLGLGFNCNLFTLDF